MGNDLITFRKAHQDDSDDIFKWRNDPATRQACFNSAEVAEADHKVWFEKLLNDKTSSLYIVEIAKAKAAVFRVDCKAPFLVEVNINLAPDARGKGAGWQIIEQGCLFFARANSFSGLVLARVKAVNQASARSFVKAGFIQLFNYCDKIANEVLVLGKMMKGD